MAAGEGASKAPVVVVIPVEGFIDGGLFDSVKRRTGEAEAESPSLIIYRIDTYGGAVEFAMEITDFIGAIDKWETVAYVPKKAYSAGAMIAMAAREIALSPTASIGDAAPVMESPEGPEMLGEKIQSPVRNIFRKYAERNGYPIALAEAMVSPDAEVYEATFDDGTKKYMSSTEYDGLTEQQKGKITQKRTIVPKGRILTMTAKEAKDYGFARFIVKDLGELLDKHDLAGAEIVNEEVNWSEGLVRFLNYPVVAGIILLVGLIALWTEFKVPGFGLPGTVAIICFALFFFSKYLSGMAQYWEIFVFLLGAILLGIEVFLIPGFGLTGTLGIGLMLLGLALVLLPRHITTAPMDLSLIFWTGVYTSGAFAGAVVAAFALAKVLPKLPVVGLFYLGAPRPETIAHREGAGITEGRNLVGKRGTAVTMLRPAGRAAIGKDIFDVTTEGDLVAKDSTVEVIAQKGNNIIVREVKT